ncbi:MAG: sugar-binding domain-containing protein [Ignavibacteriaceae bacterium]
MFNLITQILFTLILIQSTYAQIISLNGEWDFITDSKGELKIESLHNIDWRKAIVPLSWQAQFEDLRDYQGVGWYKMTISLENIDYEKLYIIKFYAVDYLSRLFVNKEFIGEHEGGYTPFEFDITQYLKIGENEIILRVLDPLNEETPTEGIDYYHIPHGKQTWYVQTSGIWQGVSLLINPEQFIRKVKITPTIDGRISFEGILNKSATSQQKIEIKIFDPSGKEILNREKTVDVKENTFVLNEVISNPLLWSFEQPNLYRAQLKSLESIITETFGFRSIESKNNKLYLNGKPFYLIAALDQDFYPETIYTTPSEEYLRNEMLKAKKLGLNLLRCHVKVPDPLYLKIADEVGLLVWYEVPNWDVFNEDAAKRGSETIDNMLERDWNHPSLVILSLINESWGIDLHRENQRNWLVKEFDRVKAKASGRLVVDNSACWGNFHIKSDLNDYHTYWAIPENKNHFDKTIDDVASRPKWLYSEFGDSQEEGNEPLLISEFGNWGLPKLPEKIPWWFDRQFLDIEVSLPAGVYKRFIDQKFDKTFSSYNQLAEESQHSQFNSLKYEIEKIRMTSQIQGYVITEFTDINWESNGLLDIWRNFKVYSDDLPLIQQQDIIIPRPVKYNYWSGEEAEIDIFISHYSDKNLSGLKLEWKLDENINGSLNVDKLKEADVTKIETLKFALPEVNNSQKLRIDYKLIDSNKNIVAKNYLELFVFETFNKSTRVISLFDPNNKLEQLSEGLDNDYQLSASADIIFTNLINQEVFELLNEGKTVICLIDSTTKFPESFSYKISSREEEWLDGNWATNMNWIRDYNPLFNGISFGKTFGFEIEKTVPRRVISDIPSEIFDDVLSGMFVGWLHKNYAYILQMNAGNGKIIFCTFPLAENYSTDPFAKLFVRNLIDYTKSNDFNPTMNWK